MTVQVSHTVAPTSIRKGDVISGMTVATVKEKKVNVAVVFQGATQEILFRKDEEVTVERTEFTDEERKAREQELVLDRCTRTVEAFETALAPVQAKITEAFANGYVVDGNTVDNLLQAQAKAQIAAGVRQMAAFVPEGADAPLGLMAAVTRQKERLTESLVEGHNGPTYSGGFSGSNAERQAAQTAAREFIHSIRYFL